MQQRKIRMLPDQKSTSWPPAPDFGCLSWNGALQPRDLWVSQEEAFGNVVLEKDRKWKLQGPFWQARHLQGLFHLQYLLQPFPPSLLKPSLIGPPITFTPCAVRKIVFNFSGRNWRSPKIFTWHGHACYNDNKVLLFLQVPLPPGGFSRRVVNSSGSEYPFFRKPAFSESACYITRVGR